MTIRISLAVALACCPVTWAADFHPLNIKPGEWQSTVTMTTSGMPAIPPEVLAKLPPEQRAKIESRMKGAPQTSTVCVKKEKLDQPFMMDKVDKACTHDIVTSSGSMQEIHVECTHEKSKTSGVVRVEAMDSENIRGSMQMNTTHGERTMTLNSTFTSKWLGSTCSKE